MKITLEILESLLADKCEKIDDLRVFSSVSPEAYAVPYIAARQGFIASEGALFAARHCEKLTMFLIDNVLTIDDKEEVDKLSLMLWFSPKRTDSDEQLVSNLQGWMIGQKYLPK